MVKDIGFFLGFLLKTILKVFAIVLGSIALLIAGVLLYYRVSVWESHGIKNDTYGYSAQSYFDSLAPFPETAATDILRHREVHHVSYYRLTASFSNPDDYEAYCESLPLDETFTEVRQDGVIYYHSDSSPLQKGHEQLICLDSSCLEISFIYTDWKLSHYDRLSFYYDNSAEFVEQVESNGIALHHHA